MRDQFVGWCRESGYAVTVDRVGSIFARRAGTDVSLAPVVIGSHLDTQVNGGRYDGVVGVLAGLEALRTLDDRRVRTRRPIEVVSWTNEEGARFTPPMIASGAFAGVYEIDWLTVNCNVSAPRQPSQDLVPPTSAGAQSHRWRRRYSAQRFYLSISLRRRWYARQVVFSRMSYFASN